MTDEAGGGAHRAVYRPDRDPSVGMAVVEALAAARGVAPADVHEPLYDSVDPDALERLFAYGDAADAADGTVVFAVGGRTVTVHSDGAIVVGSRD